MPKFDIKIHQERMKQILSPPPTRLGGLRGLAKRGLRPLSRLKRVPRI